LVTIQPSPFWNVYGAVSRTFTVDSPPPAKVPHGQEVLAVVRYIS
jgi:hypothetical protein